MPSPQHPISQRSVQEPDDLSPAATLACLAAVAAIALAARLAICFMSGLPVRNTDTEFYFRMADAILIGAPTAEYFPNGYPLIVAAAKLLAGARHFEVTLLLLNAVLSTATVVATFFIARRLASARLALVAAGLVALWPNQLDYTRQLLSEVPSTFFLTLALAALLGARPLAAGMLFSAAALVRNSLTPIGPLVAACLFVARRRAQAGWLVTGLLLVVLSESVLIALGTLARPRNFGFNLMIAIGSNSTDGIDFGARAISDADKTRPIMTYVGFALSHPAEFLWQRWSSVWELWGPWPAAGDPASPRSTVSRLAIGLRFPALLLALAALWIGRRRVEIWCLAVPVLAVTATHAVFFSTPRFTYPAEPALIVLATLGAAALAGRRVPGLGEPA